MRNGRLLDAGTETLLHPPRDGLGVQAARGRVDGCDVLVYCTDGTRMGGAMGYGGCVQIAETIDLAVTEGLPVIGIWHSDGARLAEGVHSMDGAGLVFAAMVRASGRIPQLSVVVGPAAGGSAYGPALTNVVIMSKAGRIFVAGPDVVSLGHRRRHRPGGRGRPGGPR